MRRRLRIGMVVASPFPADHGTPGSIREMTEAIAARGHDVHIATYHFGQGDPPRHVRIHRVADLGFPRRVAVGPSRERPILDLLLVLTTVRMVVREGIDVIHAHNYEGALVGYAARVVTRRPLVYNAVNTMIDELPTYGFFRPRGLAIGVARFLDYWVPRTADKVVCLSDELAAFLRARGLAPGRIATIPLGVDTTVFDGHDGVAVRGRYGLGTRPLVVYTGTLDRFQRIDYLVSAMRSVADHVPEARLLIAANIARAKDLEECREMAERAGVRDRVIVTPVAFEEVPAVLAAADVAVVPRPHCPGFPVKLLNYMAAARPIVVFEGSAKGLQHMKHALVARDHDWNAMVRAIVLLLCDRALARELGKNARRWAEENLSWPSLAARTEAIYYELVGAEGQGARAGGAPPLGLVT